MPAHIYQYSGYTGISKYLLGYTHMPANPILFYSGQALP
jgi:hypothetical protein